MGINEAERRVLEAIDIEGMLGYLCELISIPSVGNRERAAQENVALKLRRIGLKVDVWELDLKPSGSTRLSACPSSATRASASSV